jgi:hypothetical protein
MGLPYKQRPALGWQAKPGLIKWRVWRKVFRHLLIVHSREFLMFYNNPKVLFYIVIIISLLSTNIFTQRKVHISPKFTLDLAGNHSASLQELTGDKNVNTSYSLGIEIFGCKDDVFNFGGGIMYLAPREQEIKDSGKFNFIPIYAIGKLNLADEASNGASIILNIGYNLIFNGDTNYAGMFSLNGGLLFGGGIRYSIYNFYVEALYKSLNGSASYEDQDSKINFDITYTTLSIGIGFLL